MNPSTNRRILVIDDTASIHADFRRILSRSDAAPELEAEYRRLLSRTNGMIPTDFTAATERLRSLVQHLNVPEQIGSAVAKEFGRDVRLIVRSSANCEDLEEFAGAGLYSCGSHR